MRNKTEWAALVAVTSLAAACESGAGDFALVAMSPQAESAVAAPRSVVVLTFSEAVDPGTVNTGSVVLRERESQRVVPASLAVAGEVVTLTPLRPLESNYRYTVDLHAIGSLDPYDNTIEHQARFFTATNFATLYLRYPSAGDPAYRSHVYSWDESSRGLQVGHFTPGPDGALLTFDDVEDTREDLRYDADRDYTRKHVLGCGPDATLGSADDVHLYERVMTYGAAGLTTRQVVDFGADGLTGTADDTTFALETYHYDADDRYVGSCNGTTCTRYDHGANQVAMVTLAGPGPDGAWRTADDVLASPWRLRFYDAVGVELGVEEHALAPDGTATVTPTSLLGYTDYTVSAGLATAARTFTAVGADGLWRTADDGGDLAYVLGHEVDGTRATQQVWRAGGDGRFDTADDELYEDWYY